MFEQNIRSAQQSGEEVTIFTQFGIGRGRVLACFDGWFTIQLVQNDSKVNVYYEDVMLLEQHGIV